MAKKAANFLDLVLTALYVEPSKIGVCHLLTFFIVTNVMVFYRYILIKFVHASYSEVVCYFLNLEPNLIFCELYKFE